MDCDTIAVFEALTLLDIQSIKRSLNQAGETYDEAAVLQREVADRLLDQLEFMLIEPKTILDCGARTGYVSRALQQRYPKARVLSLDLANRMLEKNPSNLRLCSTSESLPIQKQSVDMIFVYFI